MPADNYRVRMRSNRWYVDELSGLVHIVGHGPYETIGGSAIRGKRYATTGR